MCTFYIGTTTFFFPTEVRLFHIHTSFFLRDKHVKRQFFFFLKTEIKPYKKTDILVKLLFLNFFSQEKHIIYCYSSSSVLGNSGNSTFWRVEVGRLA